MNFYETMYIVHPALQAGRLDDIVNNINTKIDGLKGKRLYIDNWGKKKLSYAIDKQKYGTYILVQFEMGGDGVHELSNEFEHNGNILRYLINRIEKTDILEQKEIPPSSMNDEAVKESPKENVKKDLSNEDNAAAKDSSADDAPADDAPADDAPADDAQADDASADDNKESKETKE